MLCNSNAVQFVALIAAVWLAGNSDAVTSITGVDRKDRHVANFLCEDLKEAEKIPLSATWPGCAWSDLMMSHLKSLDGAGAKKVYRAILSEVADQKKNKVFYFEYAFQCGPTADAIAVRYYPKGRRDFAVQDGGMIWASKARPITWGSQIFDIEFTCVWKHSGPSSASISRRGPNYIILKKRREWNIVDVGIMRWQSLYAG